MHALARLPGASAHDGALSTPQVKLSGMRAAPSQRRRSKSHGGTGIHSGTCIHRSTCTSGGGGGRGGRGGGGGGRGGPRLLLVIKGARLEQPTDEAPLQRGELPHSGRMPHLMREAIRCNQTQSPPIAPPHSGRMPHQLELEIEPSDAARCSQMRPDAARCGQMQSDAIKCTQMQSAACRTNSSSRLNRLERSS